MACFAGINVSQGSVATYARCNAIFSIHLTLQIYEGVFQWIFKKSVKIWQNYGHESAAHLFGPLCRPPGIVALLTLAI